MPNRNRRLSRSLSMILSMAGAAAYAAPVTGPLPEEVGVKLANAQLVQATMTTQPLPWLGKTLRRLKAVDAATNQPVTWVWDETGALKADLGAALEKQERQARRADMGALSDSLWARYVAQEKSGPYPVLIWLPTYEPFSDKAALIGNQSALAARAVLLAALHSQARANLWSKAPWLQAIARPVAGAPALVADLTINQVAQLTHLDEVAELLPFQPGKPAGTTSYVDTLQAAFATTGYSGSGIRVCMIESTRPTNAYTAINDIAGHKCAAGAQDIHSRCVAAVIRSTVDPKGTAKDSTQYWGNWNACSTEEGGIRYCADNAVKVWNIGYDLDGGGSRLLDYWVKTTPFPFISVPIGTTGATFTACNDPCTNTPDASYATGANVLLVGGSRDCGDSDRSNDLAFCEARSTNAGTTDREEPQLVAPAKDIDSDGYVCGSGVSWASAMVAGIATQLLEENSALDGWPEAMRAILTCTANENIHGGVLDLDDATDDRDGAGEANAYRAVRLAISTNKRNGGNAATAQGYDYGTITSTDTPAGNFYSEVYAAKTLSSGKRTRVVLTWDGTATCSDNTDKTTCSSNGKDADLDLYVYKNGQLVDSSVSVDNTFEFVEFDATANDTYDIKVKVYSWTESSTYFALAWEIGDFSTN